MAVRHKVVRQATHLVAKGLRGRYSGSDSSYRTYQRSGSDSSSTTGNKGRISLRSTPAGFRFGNSVDKLQNSSRLSVRICPIASIRIRNPQLSANRSPRVVVDLAVTRHRRLLLVGRVEPNRVCAAFSKKLTAVRNQMPNQLLPLHETTNPAGIWHVPRLTWRCRVDRLFNIHFQIAAWRVWSGQRLAALPMAASVTSIGAGKQQAFR